MKTITPKQLKELIDNNDDIQIVDIRDPVKFEAGHIPGSISIPQKEVPAKTDLISRTARVIIACTYGMKSDQVYLFLREKHKFKNLYILEGGLYDYARDVDPNLPIL